MNGLTLALGVAALVFALVIAFHSVGFDPGGKLARCPEGSVRIMLAQHGGPYRCLDESVLVEVPDE